MNNKLIAISLSLMLCLLFSPSIQVVAQTSNLTAQSMSKNQFRIVVALFGIKADNSDMFIFTNAQNNVKGKIINATQLDHQDNFTDGIAEIAFSYPNSTIDAGDTYSACVALLQNHGLICNTNFKSAKQRPGFIQLDMMGDGK